MKLVGRAGGVEFRVRAQPRAGRRQINGPKGGALRVRLTSPPVDGAANRELRNFLAKRLKVPPSRLTIVSGAASRDKKVRVEGLTPAEVKHRLEL